MSKKTLSNNAKIKAAHKKAAISAINSAKNLNNLASVFFDAFGDQFLIESQMEKGSDLKENLANAVSKSEKYRAFLALEEFEAELRSFGPTHLSNVDKNINLLSTIQNNSHLKDENFPNQHLQEVKKKGEDFLDQYLDYSQVAKLKELDAQTKDTAMKAHLAFKADNESDEYFQEKAKLTQLNEQKKQLKDDLFGGLMQSLLNRSSITDEQAKLWSDAQPIASKALSAIEKGGYSEQDLRRDLAEFYKLSNGLVGSITFDIIAGKKRASANLESNTIYVGQNFDKRVLWHEASHLIEVDMLTRLSNRQFIEERSTDSPEHLSKLIPKGKFENHEIAYPDHFISPYVGKIYESLATEVASIGVQELRSTSDMGYFYSKDPEHFKLIVGMLLDVDKNVLKKQNSKQYQAIKNKAFYDALKKHTTNLNWVEGHSPHLSSEQWILIKAKAKAKANADSDHYARLIKKFTEWTLGSTTLALSKFRNARKLYPVVKNKGDSNRNYFYVEDDRSRVEAFIYLREIDLQKIFPNTQDPKFLLERRQAPSWYEIGMSLPIL